MSRMPSIDRAFRGPLRHQPGALRRGIPVSKDGPDSVYVPTTEAEWEALGIPAPTLCYGCQDASGALQPSIGSTELVPGATGHLYEQSVTGWSRKFVGTVDGASGQRWSTTAALMDLSLGDSFLALVYTSYATPSSARLFLLAQGFDNSARAANSVGRPGTTHASVTAVGATDHGDIGTVRPYLWVRNAVDNASGLFTSLESVSGTHDESAVSGQPTGIGTTSSGGPPDARFGLAAFWGPTEAAALIAAGYANETLLTALGWSLAY